MGSFDPSLAKALAEGTYVVDARAVADAIVRREAEVWGLSRVLEAAELHGAPVAPEEDEPVPGADAA